MNVEKKIKELRNSFSILEKEKDSVDKSDLSAIKEFNNKVTDLQAAYHSYLKPLLSNECDVLFIDLNSNKK